MNEQHAIFWRWKDGEVGGFRCLCGKHFPGFGLLDTNMAHEDKSPLWHISMAQLREVVE